jgi:galactoside 2-L-fucosyltransferase 1/2
VYIAVHVRRTDWLKVTGDVCGIEYLHKAIRYMINLFRGRCLMFVVCSDDMDWTRSNFQALLSNVSSSEGGCKPKAVFSIHRSAIQDMAILASCNHTIITMGSFGWWSAYLAGGVTVYCDKYPPTGQVPLMVRQDDFYLPKWTGFS